LIKQIFNIDQTKTFNIDRKNKRQHTRFDERAQAVQQGARTETETAELAGVGVHTH
jgi:hypothetical protein